MSQSKPRFISGIYNYCDYWCERCAFAQRCRNHAMGRDIEQEVDGQPVQDATNASFWNGLAEKLRETTIFGPPEEWVDECDDVFDDVPDDEWLAHEEATNREVRNHALSRDAEEYMTVTDAWLKAADADLKTVAGELMEAAASPYTREDVEEKARQIGEMIEVVAWYHTLIPSKLRRAVRGKLEQGQVTGPCADILAESRLYDSNGSGKIALVAIERSMAAWLFLHDILPAHESAILERLALLDRMRRGIYTELPGAASFQRPGFDYEPEEEEEEWD